MAFITRQGFPREPALQKSRRLIRCFDGQLFAVSVAQHADRANDHVLIEVPHQQAKLSPSDARQLAARLVQAAEELEGGHNVAFIARVPR